MEVPARANSWQLWLSVPSLPAESTFSGNAKHETQVGKQVGKKNVRDEASFSKVAGRLEVGRNYQHLQNKIVSCCTSPPRTALINTRRYPLRRRARQTDACRVCPPSSPASIPSASKATKP